VNLRATAVHPSSRREPPRLLKRSPRLWQGPHARQRPGCGSCSGPPRERRVPVRRNRSHGRHLGRRARGRVKGPHLSAWPHLGPSPRKSEASNSLRRARGSGACRVIGALAIPGARAARRPDGVDLAVLLGDGARLTQTLGRDMRFQLVAGRAFENGLVYLEYLVVRQSVPRHVPRHFLSPNWPALARSSFFAALFSARAVRRASESGSSIAPHYDGPSTTPPVSRTWKAS
jgi:hypothetical protein